MSNVQMKNEGSCAHCGTKLKPYDMFCEECLAITPRGKANTEHLTNYTCTDCGTFLHPNAIFCSECFRLAPDVQAIPITYKDYTGRQLTPKWRDSIFAKGGTYTRICPYCNHKDVVSPQPRLGSPIERCSVCRHYFANFESLEWSVISKQSRFQFKYFNNFPPFFTLLYSFAIIVSFLLLLKPILYVLWLLLIVVFSIFWSKYWNHKNKLKVLYSYKKLERNPEYINILKKINYFYLDKKYKKSDQ